MLEQLARELAWLGAGALFAWLGCAFAQLSALAPVRAWRSSRSRTATRCARRAGAPHKHRLAFAISFALLLTVPPGAIAAGWIHAPDATVAVEAGVLGGLCLAGRRDLTRRARVAALLGGVSGACALTGAFVGYVLQPERSPGERVALFVAAATGAMLTGGALSLFSRGAQASRAVRRRVPFGRGDRIMHAMALLLGAALGYGFLSARASPDFEISVLVAASVLCVALGARLMSGARRPRLARAGAVEASPPREPFSTTFNASFAGVPDEMLVAACGSGAFAPPWLAAGDTPHGGGGRAGHHASQDLPRRRRSRGGALRQRQGPH
ncbi:hypothetical protein C7410_102141 [Paraburkholderia silvatlantica]|uniref:Uncharacterized protein n=1 Tax=Paraburkholderia silvatlantica TaxID=321895 RepID=A0A2V4U1A8_9BURK|nr:hypothetical protein [Paraburkholderia silvatlantica]PYE27458.1 hypothetical protein C7410_102141 [Paraburkholderia silvatlantica]